MRCVTTGQTSFLYLFSERNYFILNVSRYGSVMTEFHVGNSAAFGERAKLGGEAEELGERDFGGDDARHSAPVSVPGLRA